MDLPDAAHAGQQRQERRWAVTRLALGMAQMAGAVISLVLLAHLGVTSLALTAVCLTSLLTTISVLLFGWRHTTKATAHRQRGS